MPKMTILQALKLAQAALESMRSGATFPATDSETQEAIEVLLSVQGDCPEVYNFAITAGITALKMPVRFGGADKRIDKALEIMTLLINWADMEEQNFYLGCLANLRQYAEALPEVK